VFGTIRIPRLHNMIRSRMFGMYVSTYAASDCKAPGSFANVISDSIPSWNTRWMALCNLLT